MAKKKKKQLNLKPVAAQAAGCSDDGMLNEMHHSSDMHFTLYVVSNGYMLASFFRKRRPDGDIIGAHHDITYVPTLDDVPNTVATLRAAFVVK